MQMRSGCRIKVKRDGNELFERFMWCEQNRKSNESVYGSFGMSSRGGLICGMLKIVENRMIVWACEENG